MFTQILDPTGNLFVTWLVALIPVVGLLFMLAILRWSAWLATLIGLFETGYITSAGFFNRDVREHNIRAPGMNQRVADAIRRGKFVCDRYGVDLFEVDYHELADRPVGEVRELLSMPPKSSGAIEGGSAGLFDLEGMSEKQRRVVTQRRGDNT